MSQLLPKSVMLAAEYECWCFWNRDDSSEIDLNLDVDLFPLSDSLIELINEWMDVYEGTYVRSNPIESGFKDEISRASFNAMGNKILAELKKEIPSISWSYRAR